MAEVRAAYLQLILRQCRGAQREIGAQILARLPASDIARIDAAGVADWLPFALHQRLQDAKNEVVGPERAAQVTRTLTIITLGTPLFEGFAKHLLRLLDADPGPVLRWLPRAHGILFRGAGRLDVLVDRSARRATIHLTDMPREVAESRSFVASVGHALSGVLVITGFDGSCTLADWEPERGQATFEMPWEIPARVW